MKTFNEKIEKLLLEKPFDLLTKAEKEFVLREMEEQEYQSLYWMMSSSRSVFEKERTAPSPSVKTKLQAAMDKRQKTGITAAWVSAILSYKIPAYQVALASCLLLVGWMVWPNVELSAPEQLVVYKTDTIYKEIEIPVPSSPKTLIKSIPNPTKKKKILPQKNTSPILKATKPNVVVKKPVPRIIKEEFGTETAITEVVELNAGQIQGRSLKADADLLVFLAEVD